MGSEADKPVESDDSCEARVVIRAVGGQTE